MPRERQLLFLPAPLSLGFEKCRHHHNQTTRKPLADGRRAKK
jgi:hypothetical protein